MSPSWWVMGKTAAVQADAFPCVFILNTKGDDVLVIAPDSIPGHDLLVEVNLVFHDATVTIAGKPYLPATMLAFRYLDEHDLLPKKNN